MMRSIAGLQSFKINVLTLLNLYPVIFKLPTKITNLTCIKDIFLWINSQGYTNICSFSLKDEDMKDETVDGIAAIALILLVVATAVFWVSSQ